MLLFLKRAVFILMKSYMFILMKRFNSKSKDLMLHFLKRADVRNMEEGTPVALVECAISRLKEQERSTVQQPGCNRTILIKFLGKL